MRKPVSLALIPARGGSKRLTNKVMRQLAGKTLLARTIEAVMQSGCFGRIIVSSESPQIQEHALAYPGIEVRVRPQALASDEATTMDVLSDLLRAPERHPLHPDCHARPDHEGIVEPSTVVGLFQPTSPFRTPEDVRGTVALLGPEVDCAIAIVETATPPQHSFGFEGGTGRCVIAHDSALLAGRTRKQSHQPMYTPNGAAYVSTARHILEHRSFFAGAVAGYVMTRERSLDIDDEFDWRVAVGLAGREDGST